MITELAKNVYWVGVVDWDLEAFEGHELTTHRGTTYNSYLITDEKTVLVDCVWGPFADRFIENIRELVDPAKIDIIVSNHAEVDHSGALPALVELAPNAELIVSEKGVNITKWMYHKGWKLKSVKTGDRIGIGSQELLFFEAPMLHWPDSMFTYLTGSRILMPNDAFGQHYATEHRFNDQVDQEELIWEARKYYANIVHPFSKQVVRKIDELLALELPIEMILPAHGVLWRDNPLQIVELYRRWAAQEELEPRAVVLYDTMWQATRKMAEAICEGLASKGFGCKLYNLAIRDRNDIVADMLTAKALIVGSPTFNGGILPGVAPLLEDFRGQKYRNKIGAAFGSWGWSGEAAKHISDKMAAAGIKIVAEPIRARFTPNAEDLENCRELGRQVAKAILF
jgi:anaerobic nitric oxide reductase flavorubredoxin